MRTGRLALLTGAMVVCAVSSAWAGDDGEKIKEHPKGWVQTDEFRGKRILMVTWYSEGGQPDSVPLNHVPKILERMGFKVERSVSPKHLPDLEKYDQVWMISGGGQGNLGGTGSFDASDVEKLKSFVAKGKGLYSLNDNEPYVQEGNVIGKALHGISMSGGYYGGQMVNVVSQAELSKIIEEAKKSGNLQKLADLRRSGVLNGKLYAQDHELFSGIERIMEGITICHMTPSPELDVILRNSNNESLVAVSKKTGENMLYDCGFTRMYVNWEQHQDTATRWYENVARYLQGKRRTDLAAAAKGAQP